jgi:transposase
MNFLSDEEKSQLKAQHKQERDKRICDRIKAVLLYDKGWSLPEIAEALLLSDDAIGRHIDDYKRSKKLKPESGGSTERLSEKQSKQLEELLQRHTYLFVKDIVFYVQCTWKISYTIHGMRNWLQRHGFSYKKPSVVPGKANEQQQKAWIAEYERLRQNLPKDETICFIDGVHPTHNTQPAYGWIKKGVRKEIPSNTGRARLNITGSLDIISHKLVIQEDKTLNAEATLSFFQKIEKAYPAKSKIHIFCDNARYYRNRNVKKYLERSKIELHFLPPYSPNLNPIERLWKWMKERVIYNTYYEEPEEFRSAVIGFFTILGSLDPKCEMGQYFRQRIRDKFRTVASPLPAF